MGRKAFIGSELIFSDTVHQFLQVLTLSHIQVGKYAHIPPTCKNLLHFAPIWHIPRLRDTLDSKTVKIEIKSQLSVFHFISFEYLQNELDKELLYKILIGSSIFSYFKVLFFWKILFFHILFGFDFFTNLKQKEILCCEKFISFY